MPPPNRPSLLLNIPNLTHDACPVGSDESANPVVREWGDKPEIAEPKDHVELALQHGLIDWDDGIRVAGSGFVGLSRQRRAARTRADQFPVRYPDAPTATRRSTCRTW
jgi:seryl-tRNA synthetase